MWPHVALVRIGVSEEYIAPLNRLELISSSFHLDDEDNKFLRNVASYKNHTASHPARCHSSALKYLRKF
jgi:hypothetical protein